MLKLLLLPVEDQEFIAVSLSKACSTVNASDCIKIYYVHSIKVEPREDRMRFLIEHEFACSHCGEIYTEEVNLYSGKFRDICENCYDKAYEHMVDDQLQRVPQIDEDHD